MSFFTSKTFAYILSVVLVVEIFSGLSWIYTLTLSDNISIKKDIEERERSNPLQVYTLDEKYDVYDGGRVANFTFLGKNYNENVVILGTHGISDTILQC